MKRKSAMEKGHNRSREDREWISKMLAKDSTRIVSSQQVVIVAPTPSAHQDVGTIRLDPLVTRARKRARQTTFADSRTASQDSCTPRNPLQDNTLLPATNNDSNVDDKAKDHNDSYKEGYTPPLIQEAAQIAEARKARILVDLIKQLLDNNHPEARKAAQGLLNLARRGILKPGIQTMERIEPETIREVPSLPNKPETQNEDNSKSILALIKTALELTKNSCYETPARKLMWGLTELVKLGVI